MNSTLVITHSADLDGLCSQAIARRALGDQSDYLGWDYGDDIPDTTKYSRVFLIDISFPPPEMLKLVSKLVWIDHHQSAIKENPIYYGGLRIDGVAACRLAWQWFFGDPKATKADYVERKVSEPYAVQLLGEFDIWCHTNEDTVPFQYAMQAEITPDWPALFAADKPVYGEIVSSVKPDVITPLLVKGRAITQYLKVTQAQLSNEAGYDADFEGLKFRVLNTPQKGSLQFDASIKPHHDGCLRYYWDGQTWGCSLYGVAHKKDVDLSVIAKKYGGGGHKQACGCTFDQLPKELGGQST